MKIFLKKVHKLLISIHNFLPEFQKKLIENMKKKDFKRIIAILYLFRKDVFKIKNLIYVIFMLFVFTFLYKKNQQIKIMTKKMHYTLR